MKICDVCKDIEKSAKYTCPACLVKSCSVECSKAHKRRDGCTGIRDKTKYVPKEDYDENTFYNDICLLQEIARKLDENCIKEKENSSKRRKRKRKTVATNGKAGQREKV